MSVCLQEPVAMGARGPLSGKSWHSKCKDATALVLQPLAVMRANVL